MKYPNIYSLFRDRVATFRARAEAHRRDVFYFRSGETWKGVSWDRFEQETLDFATALLSRGLRKGGSVCILMGNVPEWPISDLGTITAGGVGVGLYPTSSAEQCEYIIKHSDAEFLLVDSASQLQKILSVRRNLPQLKTIVVLDDSAKDASANVVTYADFIKGGGEGRTTFGSLLRERAETADPSDTAVMVYTSGTTGPPKGACLSHRYVINSVESLRQTIPIFESDTSFSYLPFCHVAERISGLYNRLYAGASAFFVDDLTRLGEYMLEVRPTVFASLPRFFEKIHARVLNDLQQLPPDARECFDRALEIGRQVSRLKQSRKEIPEPLQREYDESAAPALQRVKDYFGGRIRLATSGGAPLPLEVAQFFDAAGLPILQAYGLTENVCVAFNRANDHKFGTVGRPMPGCEVRLAPDGEILVRSEMMFTGYYKAPEETARMFADGWLLTGDLGAFDDDGFLKIIGRKKELIVTSTGKKVAPALLENMLKEHHLISQAMVCGEGKSYLVALITINPTEVADFATAGREGRTVVRQTSDVIRTTIQKVVDAVNKRVSSTEQIKRFAILERDFDTTEDEITPTGKIKRDVVARNYSDLIEKLYA
ncbi:MAG TPA: long-chain fatty acid--CoA ligase [Pyrinomonadaceae bacterium]